MLEQADIDLEASTPVIDWIRNEAALWPWIARFLWSSAQDLHPSRRATVMPGAPDALWVNAAALAHVSRFLNGSLGEADLVGGDTVGGDPVGVRTSGNSASTESPATTSSPTQSSPTGSALMAIGRYPIALLPQPLLARLARRVGLVLHGAEGRDDDEKALLTQRAPLYWHVPPVPGTEPESTGWYVLRTAVSDAPQTVRQRFEWKTPLDPGTPGSPLPDPVLLAGLIQKLLREFDTPWASSFATLRRPDRQIRLRG